MGPPAPDSRGAHRTRHVARRETLPPSGSADTGQPDGASDERPTGELICVSQGHRLLWVTEASRRLFGWTSDLAGGDPYAGAVPEEREAIRTMHDRIESGEIRRLCSPVVTAEGERHVVEWCVTRRRGRIYTRLVQMIRRDGGRATEMTSGRGT